VVDFFAQDIVEAFREPGCPLCRSLAERERHDMAVFVREGYAVPEATTRLVESGGFCRRHAWLFHHLAVEAGTPWVVAKVYGRVVEHDLARARSQRRGGVETLRRSRRCSACDEAEKGAGRKAAFLVDALAADEVRIAYAVSDGLCRDHLAAAIDAAGGVQSRIGRVLLDDWRARLTRLDRDLAEYDRKRDHRFAHEPKGGEQDSPSRAVRRYAGEANGAVSPPAGQGRAGDRAPTADP
jgi:hypothetical protein